MQTSGNVQQRQNNAGKGKIPVKNDTQLSGMKAICEYIQRGETTVLKLIKEYKFPAKKLLGVWEADKILVDEWRLEYLKGNSLEG